MVGRLVFNRRQVCRSATGAGQFVLLAVAAAMPVSVAHAAGTPAGTNITNTATATYSGPDGSELSVNSNAVTLRVDEVLDVTVASADTGEVGASSGATNQILKFTLTNGGDGPEAFVLAAEANA